METVAEVNPPSAASASAGGVPLRRAADVPPSEAELQADHVRALFHQTLAALAGYLTGMAVLIAIFWPVTPRVPMVAWTAAAVLLWIGRLALYLRFLRVRDPDSATLLRWRRRWQVLVLLQGAIWGAAVWLFYGLGSTFELLCLILAVFAFCLGSVQMLATQPRVFLGFTTLVLVPTIVRVATDDSQPWNPQLAGVLGLLFGMTVLMGRAYRSAFDTAVELKVRTERLAVQLRAEKAAAEEARRVAEAASAAKTQFFAAASHDLRQPLHAMGLFAEALRQRSRDTEVASLVNSINESVDALEGLFAELLDITRIDSGSVNVNPQPVPVRELFARLKLHFEPVAFEKGLMLKFHGERHVLHTDTVLVERILRNLVSNALRYTEDGGVLVSCRSRGERLLLQVWDSGIGIPADALPRVFDEFYQVQSQRPLEPHARKGLGLGLAIVQRLAGLLDAPLAVRSTPGRGSVFSVELPPGKVAKPVEAAPNVAKAMPELTLKGRTIVVVEDEAAVREGLEVLLTGWGATVLSFDSVGAVERWAATPDVPRPDLLICDYRLPDLRTGIEAMDSVRARLGSKIPAILVTGSTMIGHEEDAEAHDFHLLIKPVAPNKLRAMIAFKLGVR